MENRGSTSFGRYLKTVRLEKGIKLSLISSQTRISKDTLEALEEEDHARLPAEVFVKGFIRAYARVIGADGDIPIQGYIESRRLLAEKSRHHKADETGPRSPKGARLVILLGIFIIIVAVAVFALRTDAPEKAAGRAASPSPSAPAVAKKKPPAAKVAPPVPQSPAPVTTDAKTPATKGGAPQTAETAGPAPVTQAEPATDQAVAPAASQRLQIQVVEDTWLKVIIDSLTTNEYSLTPGDTLELQADKGFNLLIGNATGIQLTFNGKPVPIPGKSGQVVTIQLP